jgi:ribosomal protein S18 acetylase RimI-like enzyme
MVLTKSELIQSLQDEVRILLHLAGKVEPAMLDYRPTPQQRSTLQLLQYLTMMGPTLLRMARASEFDPAAWTEGEAAAGRLGFDEAVAAIAGHGEIYADLLGAMADDHLRAEVDLFGQPTSRGAFIVNNVLSGCAAYRMQLFLYLKACGRHDLSTTNLWAGVDAPPRDAPLPAQGTDSVDFSIRQFTDAWRLMCADAPAAAISTGSGIEYVFSGLPIGFFNIALVTARDVSADTLTVLAREASGFASGRDVPWMFVVTHEALAPGVDPSSTLEACGLVPLMPLTGMRADAVAPAARIPDGLELTVPQDDAGCAAALDINAAAYGMDLEAGKALLGRSGFWKGHIPVIGVMDGKPACSAAVLWVDGHRYVAMVATDPAYQRRGFADAAMRHALDVAARADGDRPTVLHATAAGRPVYERMGYETISTHTVFMEKRFLEGHG